MKQDLLREDKTKLAYQLAQEDIDGIKVEINRNTIGYKQTGLAINYLVVSLKSLPVKGNKRLCELLESKGWDCSDDRYSGKGNKRIYSKRFEA